MTKNKSAEKQEEETKSKSSSKKNPIKSTLDILNSIGEGFITFDGEAQNVERIPSGIPALDEALGGGYPKGRIIEIYGPEASGKTLALLKAYAENIRAGRKVAHFDVEQSLDLSWAASNGVDVSKLNYNPADGSAEYILGMIDDICKEGVVDIIGVDSTAALCPERELEGEVGDQNPGLLARTMAQGLRKINNSASRTGTTVIFINQVREKMAMGGMPNKNGVPTEVTPGGRALKHFCSVRLSVKKLFNNKSVRPDLYEGDRQIGHVAFMKVMKNKTAPPFGEAMVDVFYKARTRVAEVMLEALEKGVISRAKNNGKHIIYKDVKMKIAANNDFEGLRLRMYENELLEEFLKEMNVPDFEVLADVQDLLEQQNSSLEEELSAESFDETE